MKDLRYGTSVRRHQQRVANARRVAFFSGTRVDSVPPLGTQYLAATLPGRDERARLVGA